ncbi:lipoprotein-releasing system ATP-binding protein LolD 2 [Methyloglobulus morosus KoM1]|uniref:Lipoprotein-releasing system ATP-binding protein LolD 2 n=1 Tax=Methyloglobulus morosus KoM1 TaxID=1116472 RepID=V5BY83_9GAMM|nr:ABC transporter ATP-binding protein [Methyloglobulus morosus]ESS72799.1 lipoprotein-releasing system ATP-binding protein LolD 2 [Methyloglobulus morosus KoM1]
MPPIIKLKNVYKAYVNGQLSQPVLFDISLDIGAGEFVAIVGPSGNGKSTLLNLLTGIDRPSQGEVTVCGSSLHQLNEEQLSLWRGANVGIVFQFFQLLPSLNLLQNIILPMDFAAKKSRRQRVERARYLLDLVGLSDQAQQLPSQVSGGQQQRAAIARALANDPQLIVADEPTGNLDAETADAVFALFSRLNRQGKTLVMVTHNEGLAESASRRIAIHSGRIHYDRQDDQETP